MPDNILITPYFLDEYISELEALPFASPTFNGNICPEGDLKSRITSLYPPLADFVHQSLVQGHRPVSIAGDCCATLPVMAGLQRAGMDVTLIWIDAHGDFNTPETSPSGFLGGMPLAMMAGLGELSMCRIVDLKPVADKNIILTDARDLDPGEADLVKNSNILHVKNLISLTTMELPDGPLYVHFDADIINSNEAPAFNYPVPGGPSADEVVSVMRYLGQTGQVVAASMSSWTPRLDTDGQTGEKCMAAFKALLG
jgi:arginase